MGDAARYEPLQDEHGDDIGAIAVALDGAHERMLDDAARLDARSTELEEHLANVAHDLRTPIASLQLSLGRAIDLPVGAEQSELLSASLADVMYITGLVENLRLASKLEHGASFGQAQVDLTEVADRVQARFSLLGDHSGIEVAVGRPDDSVLALCEPALAEQVLSNLVHNALVHGEPGGHVSIVLEASAGEFRLSVRDDGPGVPPAELPLLAERTFRSDRARQRDPRGAGLGLAIVREVCRRVDWSLTLEPEEPRGLRVTIAGKTVADGETAGEASSNQSGTAPRSS